MNLARPFQDALREVESGRPFVPFVQGEAARLERCAIAAKRVFELPDDAAIDPVSVAHRLGVPVIGNREQFGVLPENLRKEMLGSRQWSAGTIAGPRGPLIVLNPRHADTRLKVTLAEELAHLVIGHPPTQIDPMTGLRTYNATIEQEAFSVGGALVLPYGQLFPLVKGGRALEEIAAQFGVSPSMARFRINRTGLSRMYKKRITA